MGQLGDPNVLLDYFKVTESSHISSLQIDWRLDDLSANCPVAYMRDFFVV